MKSGNAVYLPQWHSFQVGRDTTGRVSPGPGSSLSPDSSLDLLPSFATDIARNCPGWFARYQSARSRGQKLKLTHYRNSWVSLLLFPDLLAQVAFVADLANLMELRFQPIDVQ